jgi:RimJ/RimL family protein N-acetyltransferase
MCDHAPLQFQRLTHADLPLMHRWLTGDHVRQWYAKRSLSYTDVLHRYQPFINRECPTEPFLIVYAATPIGYIQTYALVDYPDYNLYVQADDRAAGVDLFIGEPRYLGQGLGSLSLRAFLTTIVFANPRFTSCIMGPEPANQRAIRTYEGVGFRYWKTIQLPDAAEPEYLMVLHSDSLLQPGEDT